VTLPLRDGALVIAGFLSGELRSRFLFGNLFDYNMVFRPLPGMSGGGPATRVRCPVMLAANARRMGIAENPALLR
jgi:hypothetical protein